MEDAGMPKLRMPSPNALRPPAIRERALTDLEKLIVAHYALAFGLVAAFMTYWTVAIDIAEDLRGHV
jgi:hypothetical protein